VPLESHEIREIKSDERMEVLKCENRRKNWTKTGTPIGFVLKSDGARHEPQVGTATGTYLRYRDWGSGKHKSKRSDLVPPQLYQDLLQ
jgi:hypothetical protein